MERVTKVFLMLTILLLVLSSDVEGGRQLKSNDKVEHPQNFLGGIGGVGGSFQVQVSLVALALALALALVHQAFVLSSSFVLVLGLT
ncbi:hypothetical protein CFP56_042750 [Quercus suber]|uniref:Transmembrane protein n=1 Tax=Quercus suber TaxID=58331 RepID=A0AAW0ISX2_QUESU